jgi:glycosyltransferase involved in cell wall biosynthesis
LKTCDIFIRPSLSEGFGVSFIEAMASQIPVIATPVGGIIDFLEDGKTGYFCRPEDPDSIVEVVQKVIADPNQNQIVENALKMVKEKYDWDIVASQIREIFDSI